jgi:DNA-binding transcriptional LysR family regulator
MLDAAKLRQVLAVQEHGSFARAAKALGIAQPSLSKSIARLEDELGVKIFARSATGSELTPVGELIAERGARVIAEAEELVREVALIAGGEAGAIRIGVGTGLRDAFLPRFTLAIALNHPNLRVHFELGHRDRLLPMLSARELDIVFCAADQVVDERRYVVSEILRFRGLAVASPGHPLAGKTGISVQEFAEHKSAGSTGSTNNAVILGAESEGLLLFYTTSDYESVLPIVERGGATLLAPDFVVRPYLRSGRLVRLDIEREIVIGMGAITTRAAGHSPILNSIIGHARAVGESLQAGAVAAEAPRRAVAHFS